MHGETHVLADVGAHSHSTEVDGMGNGSSTFPTCVRCKDQITSGHAYELGDDRWHTHCFSCYRCEKPLSCDSDFLVLGTGTLICFDCSDSCKSCGKKIGDLAIILSSSNEAYCSDCFKCCKCGDKINDLRYAKTKRGLFCIHCHEKLLAKRKQYEEKKRRLKKTLPEIPPPLPSTDTKGAFEFSDPYMIPEKSSLRPLSPLKNLQRTKSSQSCDQTQLSNNSEGVISHYLDENYSNEVLDIIEMSTSPDENDQNSRPVQEAESKHNRNVSIDDILNSTLENDIGTDEGSMQTPAKRQENTRTLLNKTPLRNHRPNNSFSKSPVGNRRGMVLHNEDSSYDSNEASEDRSGSSKEDLDYPITTAINTPTAIQVISPGKNAHRVFGEFINSDSTGPEESSEANGITVMNEQTGLKETNTVQDKRQGLALNFPSGQILSHGLGRDEDTLTLGTDVQTFDTITSPSMIGPPAKETEVSNADAQKIERNNTKTRPPTTSLHAKSPSDGYNNALPQANGNGGGNGRSIGRSFSMKSRNLVNNLRSKTSGILDPKSTTSSFSRSSAQNSPTMTPPSTSSLSPKFDSSDTHSGWGVHSATERNTRGRSPSVPSTSLGSRGQSDGIMQSERKNRSTNSNLEDADHRRTHSNASISSGINVSMYRTPPLESTSAFGRKSLSESASHLRNASWQASNLPVSKEESNESLTVEAVDENETFLEKELAEAELRLRKLKLELGELESKRFHLTKEVDLLQSTKNSLSREISVLTNKKGSFTSVDSLEQNDAATDLPETQKMRDPNPENISPIKQLSTASIARPAAKPRFWKIFSGAKQQMNGIQQPHHHQQQQQQQPSQGANAGHSTSLSSTSSNPSINNRVEISAPVLQNPNEFSDMKLLPINNKSFSSTSSQSSPSKQDGSILYGSTLIARCSYEQSPVPKIILECANHIEKNEDYMRAEGIYRKSGSQLLIEEIEREFITCDTTSSIELENLLNEDVHAVASVLKRYLRRLPNPVLSFQIYEPLINTVRENRLMNNLPLKSVGNRSLTSDNACYKPALESICKILSYLPVEHYELLKFLAEHINKITAYSDSNLMNLYNLSLVFAPGLIRDYSGDKDISDMKERNYIIGFIVGNYRDIF